MATQKHSALLFNCFETWCMTITVTVLLVAQTLSIEGKKLDYLRTRLDIDEGEDLRSKVMGRKIALRTSFDQSNTLIKL